MNLHKNLKWETIFYRVKQKYQDMQFRDDSCNTVYLFSKKHDAYLPFSNRNKQEFIDKIVEI